MKKHLYLIVLLLMSLSQTVLTISVRDIAKRAFQSVVLIVIEDNNLKPIQYGSGFFISKNIVVTNEHVINGYKNGYVRLVGQDRKYRISEIISVDKINDIALIRIKNINAKPLKLVKSSDSFVGDTIYAVGNPKGFEGTFSDGLISGIRTSGKIKIIQISAPISKGSSGGPIINNKGEVIGVTIATLREAQNLNFAIPSESVIELLESSIRKSKSNDGFDPEVELKKHINLLGLNRNESLKLIRKIYLYCKEFDISDKNSKSKYFFGEVFKLLQKYLKTGIITTRELIYFTYSIDKKINKNDINKTLRIFKKIRFKISSVEKGWLDAYIELLKISYDNNYIPPKKKLDMLKLYLSRSFSTWDFIREKPLMGQLSYIIGNIAGEYYTSKELSDFMKKFLSVSENNDFTLLKNILVQFSLKVMPKIKKNSTKYYIITTLKKILSSLYKNKDYKKGDKYYLNKDYTNAKHFFEKAAKVGSAEAQFKLGLIFYYGYGVTKDYLKAKNWLEKASKQGLPDAQYNLGILYNEGHGVLRDYNKAKYWYEMACKNGHTNAYHNLGILYYNGYGINKNKNKAFLLCEISAKKGNVKSQNFIGLMYFEGNGVQKNIKKSIYWFEKAAKNNERKSQFFLGNMYFWGNSVEKDKKKGFFWLQKSSQNGFDPAQYILGRIYLSGDGIPRNIKKGKYWIKESAKNGYKDAINFKKKHNF